MESLKTLYQQLPRLEEADHDVKMLVVFDEAITLTESEAFFDIRRAFCHVPDGFGFLALAMDTSAKLTNFAPLLASDPSARDIKSYRLLPHVLQHDSFGFVHPVDRAGQSGSKSPHFALFDPLRLIQMGRPLFSRYVERLIHSRSSQEGFHRKVMSSVCKYAISKLLCQQLSIGRLSRPEDRLKQSLALLAPRLALELPVSSTSMGTDLVSHHMAIMSYATRDRLSSSSTTCLSQSLSKQQQFTFILHSRRTSALFDWCPPFRI